MGQSGSSQSKHGSVLVRTEKPFYFSGEIVKGTVFLNIVEAGFPGLTLFLKVKGKEQCDWEEERSQSERDFFGRRRSRNYTVYFNGKNQFYNHKIQLHKFDEKYSIGIYEDPFLVECLHFPFSSLYLVLYQGRSMRRGINLVLAEIDSNHKDNIKIKHHQELIVREPMNDALKPLDGRISVQAKTCCCLSKGVSQLDCVFDKNSYLPGDLASMQIEIDNSKCELDVKKIEAKLSQTITLQSNDGHLHVVIKDLVSQKIDGIPARSHAKDEQKKVMTVQLQNLNGRGDDHTIKPSTNGRYVKSQYSLSVTSCLSGCTCCTADPTVSVPINIVSPIPLSYDVEQKAPSDWNPKMFGTVMIQFNDIDRYGKDPTGQQKLTYPTENQKLNNNNEEQVMIQNNNSSEKEPLNQNKTKYYGSLS